MASILSTERDFGPKVPIILVRAEKPCVEDDSKMEANRIGSSNNSCDTCIITTQSTSTSTSFCSSMHKTRLTKTTTTTAKTTITTTTTKRFTNCNKIVDISAKGWIFLLNAKQLASFCSLRLLFVSLLSVAVLKGNVRRGGRQQPPTSLS